MACVEFDGTKKPLDDLLKRARDGQVQLPDFQRGWVWDDEGLRSLLASISRSFPVGAVMTLQTGGSPVQTTHHRGGAGCKFQGDAGIPASGWPAADHVAVSDDHAPSRR